MGSFLSNPLGAGKPTSVGSSLFSNAYTQRPKNSGTLSNLYGLYGSNTALQNTQQGQRTAESGSLIPGYQGLIDSGGYSPTEKANIEQGTIGGIQGGYNAAQDQATRQMARTGNTAGYGSFLGSLARNRARDIGQAELGVQSQFADEAYKRKLAGLAGLQQLYGVDTSFLANLGEQQANLLGVKNKITTSQGNSVGGILSNVGQIAGLAGKFL